MYAPLRCHGHHSLLTGVGEPAKWLKRADELGVPALAWTDVDSLAGMVEFLEAAQGAGEGNGVQPIVGAELTDSAGRPGRVVALVESEVGYQNLCRLISRRRLGYDPGDSDEPQVAAPENFDLATALVECQEGLLLLADHPRLLLELSGRVESRRLLALLSPAAGGVRGLRDPRKQAAGSRNTHGNPTKTNRRTEELQAGDPEHALDEPKTPPPARPVPALTMLDAARATGTALVMVPDAWHILPEEQNDHELRVAIKHNALVSNLDPNWLAVQPAHLCAGKELSEWAQNIPDVPGAWPLDEAARAGIRRAYPGLDGAWKEQPAVIQRSLLVASQCRYVPTLGGVLFPKVQLEEGETPYSRLSGLTLAGAQRRYRPLRPEVLQRLEMELSTIGQLGFAPYFLLVNLIADFAREQNIPCVGRGSAADSLVAYCLGLTDADPLRYGLPFERFLNPERSDRPDIDLDFCWRRRDEVLEHVFTLFGAKRTAMISTLNCFGLRSAFREAALAHGIPPADINPWSSRLPHSLGSSTDEGKGAATPKILVNTPLAQNPIARAMASMPEARGFPFDDPRFQKALASAVGLLDTPRHFGLHPGGVVVAPGTISATVPCQPSSKGPLVTQMDKDGVEALGLVKMDLLGNRALTTLDDCLGFLREQGQPIDLETIPEDDPHTGRLLIRGETIGCFQIESPGMRHLLQQTGSHTMDDVIQAIALIRPGPAQCGMKDAYIRRFRGLEEPTPPHPSTLDLLLDTHGVMLYQEDVMRVAARVASMSLAEADQLRRALQKRRLDDLVPLQKRFMEGTQQNHIGREEAVDLWQRIEGFAAFAFCKAHAVTYGRIAYRAAWLKAHHPAAYLTAFLLSATGYYPSRVYVEEARRLGVRILGPDVNRSGRAFQLERKGTALRVGLERARGLTSTTLESILAARQEGGPFLSLPDFLERSGARKDETETLIQVGAFDAFDRTRPELLWRLHLLLSKPTRTPKGAGLDPKTLADCQESALTPLARQAPGSGWDGRGLGVVAEGLSPGQGASLFPAPAPDAVVLPGLPGPGPIERGKDEFRLLGLTIDAHSCQLFPCPGEERLREKNAAGQERPAQAKGTFHSTQDQIRPVNPCSCAQLRAKIGARVTLRAWPVATRRTRTSKGEVMRFLTLEDESGLGEVLIFPDVYRRDGHLLELNLLVLITGVVEDQMGAYAVRAERIW